MHFYSLAELLEEAIQDWCTAHDQRAPVDPAEISDLAVALAETLLHRTAFPIDPPNGESGESPEAQS
jgi:hypothetical protein